MRTGHADTPGGIRPEPRDVEAIRDVILARLRRRGATLETVAGVLGSSKATIHRRLKAMPADVRRELEDADVASMI